jgi:hypothetical protein
MKTARVVIRAYLVQILSVLGAAADELSPDGKIEFSMSSEPTNSAMALIQRSARCRAEGGSDGVGETRFIEILRNLPAATKSMSFYIVRQTRNRFGRILQTNVCAWNMGAADFYRALPSRRRLPQAVEPTLSVGVRAFHGGNIRRTCVSCQVGHGSNHNRPLGHRYRHKLLIFHN